MDALKALKDKLRAEKEGLLGAKGDDKRFVKKAELEAARLQKIRDEEAAERRQKELKRKQHEDTVVQAEAKQARTTAAAQEQLLPSLAPAEVIRRLRALGHPATLFGEDDTLRLLRFLKAEKEVAVEDEHVGGQQENVRLNLQKQEKQKRDQARLKEEEEAKKKKERASAGPIAPGAAGQPGPGADATAPPSAEEEALAAFERAAALVREQRAEESMSQEDRCLKWLKRWMKEWGDDLERRPAAMKQSGDGHSATLQYGETAKSLEVLYDRLRQRSLHADLQAGLWMMVKAMQNRNYLYANDIYLRLAIGNAPWPIGVTSVGIHERKAREKISHVMNESGAGQAHIMNDEATRKFLQGIKRLISVVQRLYPTDPSRSVDFQTTADMGRGMAGAGSHKQALLEAEARGETWQTLGLEAAPHFLEQDGKVRVPPKWDHLLAAERKREQH